MAYPSPSGFYPPCPRGPPPTVHWNHQSNDMNQGVGNSHPPNFGNSPFPPAINRFSMPPPPPIDVNSNRFPQPGNNANNSHAQGLVSHVRPPSSYDFLQTPPPVNFQRPPPPVNMTRPPPPLPNHYPNPSSFSQFQGFQASESFNPHQTMPPVLNPSQPSGIARPPNDLNRVNQMQPSSKNQQPYVNNTSKNQHVNAESFESELEKKRKSGEQHLSSWLQKIGKAKRKLNSTDCKRKPSNIKINDYLCKLQSSMELIKKMSNQVEKLESMISDTDKSSWQRECDIMDTIKTEHKTLKSTLEKTKVEQLHKKLTGVRLKRARLKRSQQLKYQERQEAEEARVAKEKEISEWQKGLQDEMKEDVLKKKRKQEMDQTLSAVTKKIHDANRLIDTMTALEKLRLIRQDAAKKRGDADIGESRQSFEQKIADMTRLVQSQLEVYQEEEQQLRKSIKSEQDELTEKERQLQEKKEEEEQLQRDADLHNMLFGASEDANPADPLFPYQQYHTQAQQSLPALVQIRLDWDQMLVPADHSQGSTIPPGWVVPSDPSSSTWASALR